MEPKGIIDGFKDDFKSITDDFSSKHPDLKISNFLSYWEENSMYLLFANRFDPRELHEAIEAYNKHLVKNLVNLLNQEDKYCVVALYLLYCIHLLEPDNFKVNIRLTCEEAIVVQDLTFRYANEPFGKCFKFVWKDLRLREAIYFVEESIIYGPSMLQKGNKSKSKKNETNQDDCLRASFNTDATDFLESKIEPALVGLETMLAPYEQMKDSLKLNEIVDPIDEAKSQELGANLRSYLDDIKGLLSQFKSTIVLDS